MHLVGLIRIYHDARSPKRQIMGHIYSTTILPLQGQKYLRLAPSHLKYERTEQLRTHHQRLSNRFQGYTVAEVMNVSIRECFNPYPANVENMVKS